ncbi:MAG: phenylalanine--tRNA ligase subunit beta [Candidatus Margulisiibacteriota bacterium]|jgi:phenylalanyl-tRNA synthetase beta chain
MLAPISWLKEFVNIPCSIEELAHKLTMSAFEIEQVIWPAKGIKGVVIGRIEAMEKHPNADKLQICTLNVGGAVPLSIVTGATNVQPGDVVPVAIIGAVLAGGFEIKQAKLRGVDSFGMLCSEKELGLALESAGIMQLSKDAPVGQDLIAYLGLSDPVLELSVLPNRPDLLSMIGVAREIAAVLQEKLKLIPVKPVKVQGKSPVSVEIQDKALNPRYMGVVMKKVTIKESPLWLQNRLKSAGIRPINNVVDITNYVLLEFGQPLHAFDYEKLAKTPKGERQIITRLAQAGEKLKTLDGTEKELTNDNLVITDASGPVALAGVMGGASSEISSATTSVFLEAALFEATCIRKTAKKLGYRTESSLRFERGVAWESVENGLLRAVELFQELAGAELEGSIIDVQGHKPPAVSIEFRPEKINALLGMALSEAEIKDSLTVLGFNFEGNQVKGPYWRDKDVTREADLVEEVARIIGYDKLPATLPDSRKITLVDLGKEYYLQKVRECLLGQGLNEVITFSLVSPAMVKGEEDKAVKLTNPLNQDQSVLRTRMLPSLLEVLQLNSNRKNEDIRIFETGKVYSSQEENLRIAGAFLSKTADFFALKAVLDNLFKVLKVNSVEWLPLDKAGITNANLHPGKSAVIKLNGQLAGFIGELHPAIQQEYKLPLPAYIFDLASDVLEKAQGGIRYKSIPRFPATTQDMAFMIKKDLRHAEIVKLIKGQDNKLIENVEVVDRYEGEQVPDGRVSVSYSITYRDPEKTLVEKDVIVLHEKIAKALVAKLGVKFR